MGNTIVRSYELRGSRVMLTRDVEGLYCVVVEQRGQAKRLALRDSSLVGALERFDQCAVAVQAVAGGA